MLGKKTSLKEIVAYLKKNNVSIKLYLLRESFIVYKHTSRDYSSVCQVRISQKVSRCKMNLRQKSLIILIL